MAVTSEVVPVDRYNGNGATVAFDYHFKIFAESDLVVSPILGVTQVINVHYTVSGVGSPTGGTVTFVTAPPSGTSNVVLYLDLPFTQQTQYPEAQKFPTAQVEQDFDRAVLRDQVLLGLHDREIKLPITEVPTELLTTVPALDLRASQYSGWNAQGEPIPLAPPVGTSIVSSFMETVLDDLDAPSARTTLGAAPIVSPTFTGTVTLPTATVGVTQALGDSATSISTTAFVQQEILDKTTNSYPRIPVRQTVLVGPTDANGQANWLANGTGLTIDYNAGTTPVVLAHANGFDETGEIDKVTKLVSNLTNQFGTLPASVTSYLYADRASASAITGANVRLPPQYGEIYDPTQSALLHFNGTDAATTMIDDYGNTWTASGNAQLDTAQQQFGSASLLLDGTGDFVDWVPTLPSRFNQQGNGWTIEGWFRFNALPGVSSTMNILNFGQNATNFGVLLGLNADAGTVRKLTLSLSSNGTAADIASLTLGTNTTWATNTWYHIAIVADVLNGKYFVYLNGAQDISITSALQVCQFIRHRLGDSIDLALNEFNGWMDEIRLSPCVRYPNGTAFTPSASAFSVEGHFFSIPQMRMWEVTGASVTAGVNPALTNRSTRLFVGDADAGAATITTTRSYAYRGRYTSPLTAVPAPGTRITFQANLGLLPLINPIAYLVCHTANAEFVPGMQVVPGQVASGVNIYLVVHHETRNLFSFIFGTNLLVMGRTGGTILNLTSASWKLYITAQRGW